MQCKATNLYFLKTFHTIAFLIPSSIFIKTMCTFIFCVITESLFEIKTWGKCLIFYAHYLHFKMWNFKIKMYAWDATSLRCIINRSILLFCILLNVGVFFQDNCARICHRKQTKPQRIIWFHTTLLEIESLSFSNYVILSTFFFLF